MQWDVSSAAHCTRSIKRVRRLRDTRNRRSESLFGACFGGTIGGIARFATADHGAWEESIKIGCAIDAFFPYISFSAIAGYLTYDRRLRERYKTAQKGARAKWIWCVMLKTRKSFSGPPVMRTEFTAVHVLKSIDDTCFFLLRRIEIPPSFEAYRRQRLNDTFFFAGKRVDTVLMLSVGKRTLLETYPLIFIRSCFSCSCFQ